MPPEPSSASSGWANTTMARSGTSVTISRFRSWAAVGMTDIQPRRLDAGRALSTRARSGASDFVCTRRERPVIAPVSLGSRGWLAALLRRRRILARGLLAYVTLLVLGTTLHVAHHGMKPGQASACPVLSAADQLPWTPAEPPQVLTRIVGSTPTAPEPAPASSAGRPPRHERDRAPPVPLLAFAL